MKQKSGADLDSDPLREEMADSDSLSTPVLGFSI